MVGTVVPFAQVWGAAQPLCVGDQGGDHVLLGERRWLSGKPGRFERRIPASEQACSHVGRRPPRVLALPPATSVTTLLPVCHRRRGPLQLRPIDNRLLDLDIGPRGATDGQPLRAGLTDRALHHPPLVTATQG